MGQHSAYAIDQSAPAKWRPGEELAAAGFVAITFYLFVDINLGIYRVFQKRSGLYYWTMILGTFGCIIDAIAVVLKYFLPYAKAKPLWPLSTLFILAGWTIYAPAQILVLWSRLHLVNQSHQLQRLVLITIVAVSVCMIIPTWVLEWQAANVYNHRLASLYSPREAIMERVSQIGFTFAESVISGIYIWSLIKLLKVKSSVKQRRVMLDLIYINVIAVCLDLLTVVLVYLNQTGVSHPIQSFSYILKLKMEFVVLNQLMAVAARGIRKESFAERRYHHDSLPSQGHLSPWDAKDSFAPSDKTKTSRWGFESGSEPSKTDKTDSVKELVLPSPPMSKYNADSKAPDPPPKDDDEAKERKWPMKAKFRRRSTKKGSGKGFEEGEDEEIGVHMWERRGKLVMEVPWFKVDEKA